MLGVTVYQLLHHLTLATSLPSRPMTNIEQKEPLVGMKHNISAACEAGGRHAEAIRLSGGNDLCFYFLWPDLANLSLTTNYQDFPLFKRKS
jgi:hypothetical protein